MLAIIGGTGIYQIDGLKVLEEVAVDTPFGPPSAPVVRAAFKDRTVLFLPRHGRHHGLLPHEINYRANIFALKKLGARQIIGFSATGSLRADISPGEFVIPDQYFDFVKGPREKTFFGDGVAAHVSTADPTCPDLTAWISHWAEQCGFALQTGKTYACVDGPRLGTRAESHFLRMAGCDLVGMTNIPEVFLAREAQLAYATIGIVTDYDCWMDDPSQHVSVADVIARYGGSVENAKTLLLALLDTPLPPVDPAYRETLSTALLTPDDKIPEAKREWLDVLRQ
ncbi:S-methyl-5'-thioadenosine phosphorylase [Spiribacter insolitus]|uniref:Purine nucleoside phosphorylase n=1 Tax=Spiribacter insolitus TaxID=3122417 RepID=A0ABV3T6F3_9GAMM